jgi:hypothetical protein
MSNSSSQVEARMYRDSGNELNVSVVEVTESPAQDSLPSETELFDLYEKIVETRPGTRDAEIFEKIREWTFSDFSVPPCEFAGVSKKELTAWQKRHRINLSSGHIRPAAIDLDRGHAWGNIRRANHINGLHVYIGPPSADELLDMLAGFPRSR